MIIGDMISNKKFHPVVTELFIRAPRLNISLMFISQLYFPVLKDVGLNIAHFFIMKILKKEEV